MKPTVQIKKYGNRRLYHMGRKGYITQDELIDLIKQGESVQVVDSKTGEDMTTVVLTQLILDQQRNGQTRQLFTVELLHQLIQYQDEAVMDFFHAYLPRLFNGYLSWQQEAQSQFLHWAQLGWQAGQYSKDFWTPSFPFWGNAWSASSVKNMPAASGGNGREDSAEILHLRQKVADLESRLSHIPSSDAASR